MSEQNHLWCRDVARDAAARRAEDEALVPSLQHRDLPAAVEELRERVARLEGVTQPREAATVSRENVNADGLRTERITLEVTHDCAYPASEWVLEVVQDACTDPGESVRVVEEAAEIVRLTAERDAARAEAEGLRRPATWQEEEAAVEGAWSLCGLEPDWPSDEPGTVVRHAVSMRREIGRLRARVAELEAASKLAPAANAGGDSNHASISGAGKSAESGTPEPRGWLTAEERKCLKFLLDNVCVSRETDACIDALLARSTPPRVKVPGAKSRKNVTGRPDADAECLSCWNECRLACIAAIREAGGEVGE